MGSTTHEPIRVLGLVGSLRRDSYNRRLLLEAARLAPPGMTVELYEGLGALPHFNEDVEREDYPEEATRLKAAINRADGLLIATPEYNYGIPGALKNAIDWASRPADASPLAEKPAALIGASLGMGGTARAQLALRDAFVFTRTPVLPGPEVLVSRAAEQFDEDDRLTSEDTVGFLSDLLERFDHFIRRFAQEPSASRG